MVLAGKQQDSRLERVGRMGGVYAALCVPGRHGARCWPAVSLLLVARHSRTGNGGGYFKLCDVSDVGRRGCARS